MTSHAVTPPAPGAPSARRAQTRERLIAAAVGAFAERGVIGSSVEEICERAGFTRGAFYSNFSDKDDLVLAMLQHYAERDLATVAEITEAVADRAELIGNPPGVLINIALNRLFGDADSDRDAVLARHEMDLYAIRRPQLREQYQAYTDQLYGRIGELVDRTLKAIGIEFTIDYQLAIPLLHACSARIGMTALIAGTPVDTAPMEALIRSISRPTDGSAARRPGDPTTRDAL